MLKEAIEYLNERNDLVSKITLHPELATRKDHIIYEVDGRMVRFDLPDPDRSFLCKSLDDLITMIGWLDQEKRLKSPTIFVDMDGVKLRPTFDRPDTVYAVELVPSQAFRMMKRWLRTDPTASPGTSGAREMFDTLDRVFTPDDYGLIEELKAYVKRLTNKTVSEDVEDHDRSTAAARKSMSPQIEAADPNFDAEKMLFTPRMWIDKGLDQRAVELVTIRPDLANRMQWAVWIDPEQHYRFVEDQLIGLRQEVADRVKALELEETFIPITCASVRG